MGSAALCLALLPAQQRISHAHALAKLEAGNRRFYKEESLPRPLGEGVRRTLATGQAPYAIIVTSSDSRVVPEHIFNTGFGELFVVRTAGNVCDPDTLASIEYATERFGTQLCVVLAVEGCSAVRLAARSHEKHESRAISKLVERIAPAIRLAREEGLEGQDMLAKAETENAYNTAGECLRRSRSLRTLRQDGRFRIITARYRAGDGHVEWLPERFYGPDIDGPRPGHRQQLRGPAPHVALSLLQAGHRRFLSPLEATGDISRQRRDEAAKSEQAIAVVVTCSDSRVAPEHLFDAGLGELYVVRVAGNVFNDEVQASIEYAVANTGASICVVLGHENCEIVATAIEHAHDSGLSPSMRQLLQKIEPAVEVARRSVRPRGDLHGKAVRINVQRFLTELRSRSQFLRGLEQEGRFGMLPAVYEIDSGDIHWLMDSGSGHLAPTRPAPAGPGTSDAAPAVEVQPQPGQIPTTVFPKSGVRLEALTPATTTSTDPKGERRSRALLLTIMAAAMVAGAGLLAILLWQRRSLAYHTKAEPAEAFHDDYTEDYEDDYHDSY
jgi:carbonic anhydrase